MEVITVKTEELIVNEIPEVKEVSSSSVYWYDDAPWGGCRIPKAWKIYFKDDSGEWKEVNNITKYEVKKGEENKVHFAPVKTGAVKLEVVQPNNASSGVFEWNVK